MNKEYPNLLVISFFVVISVTIVCLTLYSISKPDRFTKKAVLYQPLNQQANYHEDCQKTESTNCVKKIPEELSDQKIIADLDYKSLNQNEVIFYQSLDYYDKLINILLAMIALTGIASYIYIKSTSRQYVKKVITQSIENVVKEGDIQDNINSHIETTIERKMKPFYETMDKYNEGLELGEQTQEETKKLISKVNKLLSETDDSEQTDDSELK